MKDYYKILEVSVNATSDEIKKSYRRLALKYHPDTNSGDKILENKFKEVAEAYEILSDLEKRKSYDYDYNRERQSNSTQGPQQQTKTEQKKEEPITPSTFLDIFSQIRKQAVGLSKKRLNQYALFKTLYELLSDTNINFLLIFDEVEINREIISEVCTCCNLLNYSEVEKLTSRLVKLAGTDNETIQEIYNFNKRRKLWGYWDRYKGLSIIAGFILFMVFLGYESNKSPNSSSNRPETGNIYPENNVKPKVTKPVEDYSSWDKVNMTSGSSPECYNFTPHYDNSIDNKLQINVGSNTMLFLN